MDGWKKIHATEGGIRGLYTGVGPTLIGYSMQGAAKYGFYEYFKKFYSDLAGAENAVKYKDAIYLAGSASAEFFADMALVPMETVKVRMQTTFPPFATSAVSGLNKVVAAEGSGAWVFAGFEDLPCPFASAWARADLSRLAGSSSRSPRSGAVRFREQPTFFPFVRLDSTADFSPRSYTMMKFWSFEATVAAIYNALGAPKESYNKLQQLGVSATAGYIAGVFCAVVSHPADTMVSSESIAFTSEAERDEIATWRETFSSTFSTSRFSSSLAFWRLALSLHLHNSVRAAR